MYMQYQCYSASELHTSLEFVFSKINKSKKPDSCVSKLYASANLSKHYLIFIT